MDFFNQLAQITTIKDALEQLESLQEMTPNILKALEDAKKFHEGQLRKSGIPYIVHPICVACIVAHYGGDEAMVCAALLHDIVEDTLCEIGYIHETYGDEVGALVDALTKIVEIRNEEFTSNTSNEKLVAQALSFRKMLIASIQDPRVLAIKISDRMHNMLTLDALSTAKQIRIAEETLVVYAPIAHRLGMSSLKNELEDKSFYYIYSDAYNKIQEEKNAKRQNLELRLNGFTQKITTLLLNNGFLRDSFEIQSRIKRNYSIHLKMQRKGISMDEMLDLLAVRIIVKNPIDCYRALGIVHINLNPIPSRLKDYIALPKENGYQTIHTTVFDDGGIYEVQIRTYEMHQSAEIGMAAHWKYKSGSVSPNLNWLKDMKESSNVSKSAEEFYEVAKNDLYNADIIVFGPDGKTFSLPVGSVVLDYAYAVHSDVGDMAEIAYVNNSRAPLLQKLKSGDIVKIEKGEVAQTRCTWIDSVKTSKAKIHMKTMCNNKIKEIDRLAARNILRTIFGKDYSVVDDFIKKHNLEERIGQAATDLAFLQKINDDFKKEYNIDNSFFSIMRLKSVNLKEQKFDNLILYTNRNIKELIFDHCCHPKFGDSVVAIKKDQRAIVHHKLCNVANNNIKLGIDQIFVKWADHAKKSFKIIVSFEDRRGVIAEFLTELAKRGYNVIKVQYDRHKDSFSPKCEIIVEASQSDTKKNRDELQDKYNIIQFRNLKDAYQE